MGTKRSGYLDHQRNGGVRRKYKSPIWTIGAKLLTIFRAMTTRIPQPHQTPRILYKYREFEPDGFHIRMINNTELWFPSARHFNDPFDSSLHFDLAGYDGELGEAWVKDFISREFAHLSPAEQLNMLRDQLTEIRSDPERADWFKDNIIQTNFNKFGMCSLTPLRDNLLMWAHYADEHKGFCVGIDMNVVNELQNERARHRDLLDLYEVLYAEEMPRLNFFESMLSGHGDDNLMTLVTTKSKDWSYEQEYRLIRWDNADSAISIGKAGLAEVIFGCRISTDNSRRLLEIIDSQRIQIPIYQARQEEFRFALRFERIR